MADITFESRVKRKAKARRKTKRRATFTRKQKYSAVANHVRTITICVIVLFIICVLSIMFGVNNYGTL